MNNQEIIQRRFEGFLQKVRKASNLALCDQMEDTLNKSLNLHEQLEDGYHRHHLTESDTHGWAVAEGNAIVASGASMLAEPNKFGSAEDNASKEAVENNPGHKGVFSVTMAFPFEGLGDRTKQGGENTNAADSVRFETKLQDLLKVSARINFPMYFRKNIKTATSK